MLYNNGTIQIRWLSEGFKVEISVGFLKRIRIVTVEANNDYALGLKAKDRCIITEQIMYPVICIPLAQNDYTYQAWKADRRQLR